MADQDDEGAAGLGSVSAPVGGEAATLPAIVPEGVDQSGGRHPRWLVPVVVAVVVAVVVVAGLVGWRVVGNRRHDEAFESCSRAVKTLQDKTGPDRLEQYREAAGIKTDQVKDAKTVVAMARSVKDAEGLRQPTIRCKASMSTGDLNATADQARKIDGKYAAVARAAKAVTASRDAKTLDDARTALDGKKGEAARLLADSDGKVADNATRDGLQQVIDQAGQVKGDQAKAYRDAAAALQAVIDRVNASMQAKSQADQQAAAQAAQAQAAQQASQRSGSPQRKSATSSNRRKGYTQSRPTTGQHGGGGGGSAPSTQHSGGFNLQDYPNLWNQLQQGHEGPAIDNQGNCIADCYGWTGSN
ncbi:hypothetical protein H3V02_03510 [Bifidobacterium sp. W8106]|uniref:hypothetical protein n=1 Tax=Bifidobacterium TaxID=1678 RepID=UPI0018DC9716|nr:MULTISPECIES: hypothetical protein [Bifidobacterium]MBI0142246.1 hypothetical protein [Bifidobacterium choladohabitans]MBI0146736.1 hypothetical protein [Bifidobacterium sp. W8104]